MSSTIVSARLSRGLRATLLTAAVAAVGLAGAGAAFAQASRQASDFFALLDKIEAHKDGLTQDIVNQELGDSLYPTWTDYNIESAKSSKIKLNNSLSYSADYKGATRSNPAIRNSVVTLKVENGCVTREAVQARYSDLAPLDKLPVQPGVRPAILKPTQSLLGRKVKWGEADGDMIFRFDSASPTPDCLDAALISFVATDF